MSAKASRRLRTALVVVLILAVLYVAYRYTLHRMVEAKLDAIRKQGYPVTLAELDKWYPQPAPGENAADIYLQAFKVLAPKQPSDRNLPIVGAALTPHRSAPLPEIMKREIQQYLERNRQALDLYHKAADMQVCHFPSDPSDQRDVMAWFESLMKRLSLTRAGDRLLTLEVLAASADGDAKRTAGSIKASIALAQSVENPARLTPYLVEQACLGITISALEQALSRTAFDDRQFVDLAKAFHDVEVSDVFKRVIIGERAEANDTWQQIRSGHGSAKDVIAYNDRVNTRDRVLAAAYRPAGLVDVDYLARLEFFDELLRANQTTFPSRLEEVASLSHKRALFNLLPVAETEADLMEKAVTFEGRLQAHLRAIEVAFSVERYRLANSALPESLGALVPKFLTAVPTDPFDGRPLRYKKRAVGYVVYSVGEDREDNGGVEPLQGYGPGTDITFTVER